MLFVQALLVALWVTWAMIDEQTLQLQTTRAIITGTVVGIIMGDLKTGLIVGATVELMFLASVFVGTAVAPDVTLSAAIATAIAVLSGGGTEVAIATAIPVALIGQTMNTLQYSVVNVAILHWVERGSKKGDLNRVRWGNYIALALNAVFYGLPTFFAVFYGAEYVVAFSTSSPLPFSAGFANGGGMLAAGRLWYAADHHQMQETVAVLRHWLYCRGVPRHQQRGHRRHCCGLCFPAQLLHRQQVRADYMKEAA